MIRPMINFNPRAVRVWMVIHELSQGDVLERSGLKVSLASVSAWLRGAGCSDDAAAAIARALEVEVEDLVREPSGVVYD